VIITSQNKDEPLNKAKWIILTAGGFATEIAAQHFGDRLRSILLLAAFSSRLGVDVGEDRPTCWVREEFARSIGFLKDHERLAPNIHGLIIIPDDDKTRFPIVNAQGIVTSDPHQLLSALRELGEAENIDMGTADVAIRILNQALMTSEPLAQMVLAFSTVEELSQNKKSWYQNQLVLREELALAAERSSIGTDTERNELAQAIRTVYPYPRTRRQATTLAARRG
jgi:hypothetical protein